ncbi:uncharacterized protein LOC126727409 [Quercus robur]|uniref:uncharacterized protein LOC126727409 n=1 Tax=Quercus robur TaxID=38942 RepID=UPI002161EA02|nr:uncharacterized protein LOC126727409 [Quercus robur]
MEGNSIPNPKELRISVLILPLCCFTVNMSFPVDSFSNLLSPISSNPLFSSIVSFYTLIILYFPHLFLRIAFSPVLILTGILLFTLLRLGAAQRLLENEKFTDYTLHVQTGPPEESKTKSQSQISEPEKMEQVTCRSETESETKTDHPDPITCFEVSFSFVEWNVRAPLEVIYEEREGEEVEEDRKDDYSDPNPTRQFGLERSSSLSLYYPESDSDDSSDDSDLGDFPVIGEWSSPESACLAWEEEDREGLIEIALDHGDKKCSGSDLDLGFHVEEENLIEIDIDISPTRNEEFSARN